MAASARGDARPRPPSHSPLGPRGGLARCTAGAEPGFGRRHADRGRPATRARGRGAEGTPASVGPPFVNVELLELTAATLGDLREDVVFVGGATVELWITDEAAPEVRATYDVDVIVEVVTRDDYRAFEVRLGERGFRHDQASGVICRFRHLETSLVLDAMPLDPKVLGFENRWQRDAVSRAVERQLPSGQRIRVI